ncbi:GerAB/ArcD/ProY family transporter [Shimazuella alba]|uniref:Endospore germination permease n=1 Tax=Shimazuella alba TaxID=2690964 RepID=A0A6I4VWX4_9BACL|nr:endospore germination permease [Shimazuella alba]MXQ52512.1 endospore germination permease [Shimazuella alba]
MLKKEQIGARQFSILVLLFTIGTAIIISPHLTTTYAKQDGWISAILGTVMGISLVWVYSSLGKYFMEKTLVELIQVTLGKWIGSVFSLSFVAFLIVLASLVLMNIGHFISSWILVRTPVIAIEFMFVGLAIIGTRLGLEVLARATEVLLPFFMVLFIVFTLGLLPQIDFDNVKPVLENGFIPIWKSSVGFTIFTFGELVVFLMILPYVTKSFKSPFQKMRQSFLSGALFGSIIIFILVLLSLLVLGPKASEFNTYPAYTLATKIDLAGFFQRIEVIMAGIWFISIFVKFTTLLLTASTGLGQIFMWKEHKFTIIPIGMLTVPLSLWLSPNVAIYYTTVAYWMGIFTVIFMLLPILIVAIAWVRMRFLNSKGN